VQGSCLLVTAFGCIYGGDQTTDAGGHNIHVVGFVSNQDLAANPATATAPPGSGGGYFILKNSWRPCAGDAGYYYMPVDYVKAPIAGFVPSVTSVFAATDRTFLRGWRCRAVGN